MYARHPIDTAAFASHVSAERIQRAAEERRAREARRAHAQRRHRQASHLRPVGRLLVRLGTALGGGPETPAATTLSTVPPR
jgi:hypothetical protein